MVYIDFCGECGKSYEKVKLGLLYSKNEFIQSFHIVILFKILLEIRTTEEKPVFLQHVAKYNKGFSLRGRSLDNTAFTKIPFYQENRPRGPIHQLSTFL